MSTIPWWGWILIAVGAAWLFSCCRCRGPRPDDPFQYGDPDRHPD
jgi:hypothetical protein